MFRDREDAGRRLGKALEKYRKENPLILAIPRGGVETGYYVASHLGAELAVLVSRKLPNPMQPEAALGAIAEDGSVYILDYAKRMLSDAELDSIIADQKKEIKRRIQYLRGSAPLPVIKGRTVIIVDDGMAMGATMKVSVMLCRGAGAKKIIAAVPVSGHSTADDIRRICDDIVVLSMPEDFYAVGQVYDDFHQMPDSQVLEFMEKHKNERNSL